MDKFYEDLSKAIGTVVSNHDVSSDDIAEALRYFAEVYEEDDDDPSP